MRTRPVWAYSVPDSVTFVATVSGSDRKNITAELARRYLKRRVDACGPGTVEGTGRLLHPVGKLSKDASLFENDYIVSCETAMTLTGADKYRWITTTNCPGGIVGGTPVYNVSKRGSR